MLRIRVDINTTTIIDLVATRQDEFVSNDTVYEYDFGILEWSQHRNNPKEIIMMKRVKHKYSAGAAELGIKLLQCYKQHRKALGRTS